MSDGFPTQDKRNKARSMFGERRWGEVGELCEGDNMGLVKQRWRGCGKDRKRGG